MSANAFDLLARPIQHVLWDMGWQSLRPIQVDAIRELLQTDWHVLISARTASGKTEAAFLPILSDIFSNPTDSIGAIYVGPLKALINDQFRRLDILCERAEIPVHRWHGDVDAGKKAKVTSEPRGVLLITPESIESLFVNRSRYLGAMFRNLRFVVIDEIHALVGRERGLQLRSQLCRLQRYTQAPFRIVGLSATVGDAIDDYKRWIAPDALLSVAHISDPGEKKRVLFGIQTFVNRKRRNEGADISPKDDDVEVTIPPPLLANIIEHFVGRKNLIFCNRREQVELFADELNAECRRLGRAQEFWVHHGSLSRELREDTEQEMRGNRPATAICSSTLELGVDIGNVATVGQIGPTWSVNSLVQRLGRSGRKDDEPHCMRVMLTERQSDSDSDLIDRLHVSLLQAVATAELMRERWVEPPGNSSMDLSTLTQQILSCLAETGGSRANELFRRLVGEGAFRDLDTELFAHVLKSLGKAKLIEQAPDKTLILAPDGERVVHDFDFYSAFASGLEFSVRHDGRLIGTLPAILLPQEGDHLLLGGKRWQVELIDVKRVEILVRPAHGRKPPRFLGGSGQVHGRVREKMREALLGNAQFPYLDETSAELLEAARLTARTSGLSSRRVLDTADHTLLWFTWTGSNTQNTVRWFLESLRLKVTDHDIALEIPLALQDFAAVLSQFSVACPSAEELAESTKIRELRKFDRFLDESLLIQSLAADHIDIDGANQLIDAALDELAALGHQVVIGEQSNSERQLRLADDDDNEQMSCPLESSRLALPAETLLSTVEFIAFDLETTGFHPVVDRILEIAAVRFRLDGTEIDRFHRLLNPECDIPERATAIHGITNTDVRSAPRLEQVLPEFVQFLGDSQALLVAHNAAFDIGFLSMAMTMNRVESPSHCVLDSLQLAHTLIPTLDNGRLETVARQLEITLQGHHRALADAVTVKQIVVRLLGSFRTVGEVAAVSRPLRFSDVDFAIPELTDGFDELAKAIENRRPVIMVYAGRLQSESVRTVTPLAIVEFRQHQYLQARCHIAEQTRTYRLDRIRTLRLA
jgi:ATP-dependent Lhr-like helicase